MFLKFLDRIMGGDNELVAYLQRVVGYCLTGDTGEQAMFFGYGGGAERQEASCCHTVGRRPRRLLQDARPSRRSPKARATGTRPNLPGCTALVWSPRPRPRRPALGGKPHQELTGGENVTAHFMRQETFSSIAEVQAVLFRQPQAGPAQRRRGHAAAGQHDPVRRDHPEGRARSSTSARSSRTNGRASCNG